MRKTWPCILLFEIIFNGGKLLKLPFHYIREQAIIVYISEINSDEAGKYVYQIEINDVYCLLVSVKRMEFEHNNIINL